MQMNRADLLRAWRLMQTIRQFEERVEKEFAAGNIPGFAHLYLGEEASGVGVCFDLSDEDWIGSTHRGHGHCIAKGCDVKTMMLEIMGKSDGLCGGKGGTLGLPQGVGRPEQCVKTRRQSRNVAGRIQEYATRGLHCYFPLTGSLAGHNSESTEQIVQNLICDGQITATNKRSLAGKTDIVLSDPGQEFRVGHQPVNLNPPAPSLRQAMRKPAVETAKRFPS